MTPWFGAPQACLPTCPLHGRSVFWADIGNSAPGRPLEALLAKAKELLADYKPPEAQRKADTRMRACPDVRITCVMIMIAAMIACDSKCA